MPILRLAVEIDDSVAITIGRTVVGDGDNASDADCRQAFAAAMPTFVARAVAARYSAALDARAQARANDLASAIVEEFPEGYEPSVTPGQMRTPIGPSLDFMRGPAADPSAMMPPAPPPVPDPFPSPGAE